MPPKAKVPPRADGRPAAPTQAPPPDRRPAGARPVPPGQRLRRRTRRRRAITSGVIVVVALAGLLAFMLTRHATAAAGGGNQASTQAAIRNQAAAWVAGQVSRAATVSCDPVMCQALQAHGIAPASLLKLRPGAANPLPSSVIVTTAAVRGMLRSRLSADAPAAIAGFGTGNAAISIRVIAPRGAAPYLSALHADVAARKASAAVLLRSKQIVISAAARGPLAAGRVDPRLLVDIAGLAAQRPVSIVAFGDLAPGASPGIALRSAELAGAAGHDPGAQVRRMALFLRGQRGDYLPARIRAVPLAVGRAGLWVEFAAPSPLGLLNALVPRP